MTAHELTPRAETFADWFEAICANVGQAIRGKDEVVSLMVLALVSEGHLLVEDAPGVGKTTLAKALAASVDCTFGRLQFTPDLLPGDVVGMSVWNRQSGAFEFRPGPVFSNIVLADEINRASPKTQSALLEAMAERQVTIDGVTRDLESPFMVIATQNPIEHEGTYPLPESQLDRFLMQLSIGYPDTTTELEMLETQADDDPTARLTPVADTAVVRRMRSALSEVHVAPPLRHYLVELAAATRDHPSLLLGASPRAVLSLQRVIRAHAAATGRNYATPDDVKTLAQPVLAHRLVLTTEARLRGTRPAEVLAEVLARVPVPTAASS